MISMKSIQHRLDLVTWYRGGDCPRCPGVMSLTRGMVIDWLEINYATGTTISFGCDYHPAGPGDWDIEGNTFNHTKALVTVKATFHRVFPMDRYWAGCMDCYRSDFSVHKQSHWWHIGHCWQGLSLTAIKGTASESVQYILFNAGKVGFCWSTW